MKLKNNLKHIIVLLAILLVMAAFSYYTYDELLDKEVTKNHFAGTKNGTVKTTQLKTGDVIEQEIFFQAKKIVGMGLNFSADNNSYFSGKINVQIRDIESGRILAAADIETEEVNNSGYTYFKFDNPIKNMENKKLLLRIELTEISNGAVVFNLSDKDVYQNENLYINSELQDRDIDVSIIEIPRDAVYKVVILLLVVMTVFLILMYYLLIIKKLKVEHAFIFALVVLEFIYMFTIIPNTVPDEQTHEYGAYYISSKLLGEKTVNEEGCLYMRECDTEDVIIANGPDRQQYNYFYGNLFKKAENQEIVETDKTPLYTIPKFNYLLSGVGIALGRLMGLNQISVLMLGRLFNLIFYVVLCYYALKQMPFGKGTLMTLMLLPISLQQAMSFSYDVFLNSMSFALIAVCLKLAYDRENVKTHNYILYVVLSVLVMMSKNGAYIPLAFLILLPIIICIKDKKKNKAGSKKYKENSIRIKWLSLSLLFAFGGFLICKVISIINKSPYIVEKTDNIIQWSGTPGYTVSYFLEHPHKIINTIGSTAYEQFDFHLQTFLGGGLGWFKIDVPWFIILMCLLCILLSAVKVQGEKVYFTKYSRTFMVCIALLCFATCYGGMLLEWTPIVYEQILGVQGRYFIPFILLIILIIRGNIITVGKNIDRYIVYFMIALQPFVLYCIEHDAMCW